MRGFTLLELLVVLMLVVLVTALTIPNLEQLTGSFTRKTERDYILDQFIGLGRQAMLQGRSYVVLGAGGARAGEQPAELGKSSRQLVGELFEAPSHEGHERYVIDLPEGWELQLDEPLIIRANGVCLGAEFALRHQGAEDIRINLEPPYCRIDPDAQTTGP